MGFFGNDEPYANTDEKLGKKVLSFISTTKLKNTMIIVNKEWSRVTQEVLLEREMEVINNRMLLIQQRSPDIFVNSFLKGLSSQPIRDSLIVRLADKTAHGEVYLTSDGMHVIDNVTNKAKSGNARASIALSPFPSLKIANNMIYYAKDVKGNIFIALIEKKRKIEKLQLRGFMPPGGNYEVISNNGGHDGIARLPKKELDQAEDDLLNGNAKAYRKYNHNHSGEELPLLPHTFQKTLLEGAIREGIEETGIQLEKSFYSKSQFICTKEYTNQKRRRFQIILNYFKTYCGTYNSIDELPALDPIDTHEIKQAFWVNIALLNVAQIEKDFSGVKFTVLCDDTPIAKHHLFGLNTTLYKIRDSDIDEITNSIISTRENLINAIKTYLSDSEKLQLDTLLSPIPISEFGCEAHNYHVKLKIIAQLFYDKYNKKEFVSLGDIIQTLNLNSTLKFSF